MQVDKITKQILLDANLKAETINNEAQLQAKQILDKADEFCRKENELMLKKVEDFKISTCEKYNTLLKIESNKVLLKNKQMVLENLKEQATNFLCALDKKEKLEFVCKLIKKYAKNEETLLFNLKGITKEDLNSLNIVKDLKLKVEKLNLDKEGIILSSANCDKNLLFSNLVLEVFEEKENEINKILF